MIMTDEQDEAKVTKDVPQLDSSDRPWFVGCTLCRMREIASDLIDISQKLVLIDTIDKEVEPLMEALRGVYTVFSAYIKRKEEEYHDLCGLPKSEVANREG